MATGKPASLVTLGVALKVETAVSPAVKFLLASAVTAIVSNAVKLAPAGLVTVAVAVVVKLLLMLTAPCCWNLPSAVIVAVAVTAAAPDLVLALSADTAVADTRLAVSDLVLAPDTVVVATTVTLALAFRIAVAERTGVKK